jgi:hypothetical protein
VAFITKRLMESLGPRWNFLCVLIKREPDFQ